MLEAVQGLADFVRCYESSFLFLVAQKDAAFHQQKLRQAERELEQDRKRMAEIDQIIAHLYEDTILGKLSDDRFVKLSSGYEKEQSILEQEIAEKEKLLKNAEKATVDLRMLLKGLRAFTEIKTLTPEIVNTLIQRIEVHNSDRSSGHIRVKVDIYFTAIGMFDLPSEQELQRMAEEISTHRKKYGLIA